MQTIDKLRLFIFLFFFVVNVFFVKLFINFCFKICQMIRIYIFVFVLLKISYIVFSNVYFFFWKSFLRSRTILINFWSIEINEYVAFANFWWNIVKCIFKNRNSTWIINSFFQFDIVFVEIMKKIESTMNVISYKKESNWQKFSIHHSRLFEHTSSMCAFRNQYLRLRDDELTFYFVEIFLFFWYFNIRTTKRFMSTNV